MPSTIAGYLGGSYEIILPMTDTLTVLDAGTNLVVGVSQGAKTLTLPAISQMVASQNLQIEIVNSSGSGGTITIAKNSADSTIIGQVTVLVATGVIARHDGKHQWYIY